LSFFQKLFIGIASIIHFWVSLLTSV
jgi:hypothetical protein